MASRYKFSENEIKSIEQARKENKCKRIEARLKALELRAKGASCDAVSKITGFHPVYVTKLVAKYRKNGLEAITGNHYSGNHRNMSIEEEAAILAPFKEQAENGKMVSVNEIAEAYQNAVDHSVSKTQIYYVFHRHGWRKVMPRGKRPKKASEEVGGQAVLGRQLSNSTPWLTERHGYDPTCFPPPRLAKSHATWQTPKES